MRSETSIRTHVFIVSSTTAQVTKPNCFPFSKLSEFWSIWYGTVTMHKGKVFIRLCYGIHVVGGRSQPATYVLLLFRTRF